MPEAHLKVFKNAVILRKTALLINYEKHGFVIRLYETTHKLSLQVRCTIFINHCSYMFRLQVMIIFMETQTLLVYTTHNATSHM